jgi:hypothetical protein
LGASVVFVIAEELWLFFDGGVGGTFGAGFGFAWFDGGIAMTFKFGPNGLELLGIFSRDGQDSLELISRHDGFFNHSRGIFKL